ncbi:MAG: P-II family nitrogen regulator [Clostridia bacterium]|nr:P-II family nitrogen regulator [Clostridia bacterium]
MTKKYTHQVIFCIVNSGFGDVAMDAAKKAGARGGTIINARGTGALEAEAFFGISVQPEKEIVMIVAPTEDNDKILQCLYDEVGLNSHGQGIAFSVPVDGVVGLAAPENDKHN